ncbi:unnamed protein product, partial [Porites lobata]
PKVHHCACVCGVVTASADGEAGRSASLKASWKMEALDKVCSKNAQKPMVWTNKHNELLVQEMYLFEPWNFKRGSKQRGQVWERISESLNLYESSKFTVNQKSVRDHYIFLEKEQKKKIREEEQAS